MSGRKGYTFQQESTRFHTTKMVLTYLAATIHKLRPPNYQSPSWPDITPPGLWYLVYAKKEHVQRENFKTQTISNGRSVNGSTEIPQETVDKTIYRFCARFHQMIPVEGRWFQHLLKQSTYKLQNFEIVFSFYLNLLKLFMSCQINAS